MTLTGTLMGDPAPGRTPWAQDGPRDGLSSIARTISTPAVRAAPVAALTVAEPVTPAEAPDAAGVESEPDWLVSVLSETPAPEETVRPVAPIVGIAEPNTPPTEPPLCEWMDPTDLLVDGAYQRDLTEKSRALIGRMVEGWDWRKFKPPIAAWTERGFEIIDGQHTAIAAATHPAIDKIPVMVVEAPELQQRAAAFIGQNKDRLQVTAVQMHHAAVAAGDEDAVLVEQVCAGAGVALLRTVYGSRTYKPGETIAVNAISGLVKRLEPTGARDLLRVLTDAGCAPISANAIKAAEMLLTVPEYAEQIEPADLSKAIRECGSEAEKEAKTYADANCVPKWKGLAVVWFKRCRKRRRA